MTENISNLPMIEGKVLEDSDIGRSVWYVPNNAEKGDFSKWMLGIIFTFRINKIGPVIFIKFLGHESEAINSKNLRWSKG